MSEDCMDQPPEGIMTEPFENWRCPCSGDPVRTVGDVEGGDLLFLCEAECGWSYMP